MENVIAKRKQAMGKLVQSDLVHHTSTTDQFNHYKKKKLAEYSVYLIHKITAVKPIFLPTLSTTKCQNKSVCS